MDQADWEDPGVHTGVSIEDPRPRRLSLHETQLSKTSPNREGLLLFSEAPEATWSQARCVLVLASLISDSLGSIVPRLAVFGVAAWQLETTLWPHAPSFSSKRNKYTTVILPTTVFSFWVHSAAPAVLTGWCDVGPCLRLSL